MEIVSTYSEIRTYDDESQTGPSSSPHWATPQWDEGPVYQLIKCPACNGVMLRYYWSNDWMMPEEIEIKRLYPVSNRTPPGLPPHIEEAFVIGEKVKNIDPNLYGVQLGRLVEMLCTDRNAEGHRLDEKLRNLVERQEIPARLFEIATKLRHLRNIGAHVSPDTQLSAAEIPVLESLCTALLEYVYTAPHLLKQAEDSLARLKGKRKAADA